MDKISLHPKSLAKARQIRRKRLESMEPSKQREQLARRSFRQLNNIKDKVSKNPDRAKRYWLSKAVDPETNLIRKFKPKPPPKHQKILKYVAGLL